MCAVSHQFEGLRRMIFAAVTLKGVLFLKSRAALSWIFSFSSVWSCLILVFIMTSSASAISSFLERICECSIS